MRYLREDRTCAWTPPAYLCLLHVSEEDEPGGDIRGHDVHVSPRGQHAAEHPRHVGEVRLLLSA